MHSLAGIVDAHFQTSFRTCWLASALCFLVFAVVVLCVVHKLPCKYLYMFVCTAVSVTHHAFTSKRPKCTFPNNVRHCWLVRALRCSLKIVVPLETVCSYGGLLTHCPQCCTEH